MPLWSGRAAAGRADAPIPRGWHDRCIAARSRLGARDGGGTIKIKVWLVTRERATWITGAEILGLALVLFAGPGTAIRIVVGLPLLVLLGYTALTSLPMGAIPSRPTGLTQQRRNQDLRSRVVGFLNEVRRLEQYAHRAKTAGWPQSEVKDNLRSAQTRMMAAAAQVVKVTGRSTSAPPAAAVVTVRGGGRLLIHEKPGHHLT